MNRHMTFVILRQMKILRSNLLYESSILGLLSDTTPLLHQIGPPTPATALYSCGPKLPMYPAHGKSGAYFQASTSTYLQKLPLLLCASLLHSQIALGVGSYLSQKAPCVSSALAPYDFRLTSTHAREFPPSLARYYLREASPN